MLILQNKIVWRHDLHFQAFRFLIHFKVIIFLTFSVHLEKRMGRGIWGMQTVVLHALLHIVQWEKAGSKEPGPGSRALFGAG